MKVIVEAGRCQGHARCYAVAPQLFELDDAGYILPGDIHVAPEHETLGRRGVRACPERALAVADDMAAGVTA